MINERLQLQLIAHCPACAGPRGGPHDEDCIEAEHQAMLAGDELAQALHDPDDCYACLAARPAVLSECRCGNCCRSLIIEVGLEDALREPRIAELASPIYAPKELTGGEEVLEGFLLNGLGGPCVFLDLASNRCTIYETRPLTCRLFACDQSHCPPT